MKKYMFALPLLLACATLINTPSLSAMDFAGGILVSYLNQQSTQEDTFNFLSGCEAIELKKQLNDLYNDIPKIMSQSEEPGMHPLVKDHYEGMVSRAQELVGMLENILATKNSPQEESTVTFARPQRAAAATITPSVSVPTPTRVSAPTIPDAIFKLFVEALKKNTREDIQGFLSQLRPEVAYQLCMFKKSNGFYLINNIASRKDETIDAFELCLKYSNGDAARLVTNPASLTSRQQEVLARFIATGAAAGAPSAFSPVLTLKGTDNK